MKKRFVRFMALAAAVLCAAALASCGDKGSYIDPQTLFADTDGLTFNGNAVSFTEARTERLFTGATAEAGFTASYTVRGDDPDWTWVDTGGLYVEKENGVWHNIIIFRVPWMGEPQASACIWIIESGPMQYGSEGAWYKTDLAFSVSANPMEVQLAYYNGAYYFLLDKTCRLKIDMSTGFENPERFDQKAFFEAGTRKLGFRSAATPATFSKINFETGDEAALAAIGKMKLSV